MELCLHSQQLEEEKRTLSDKDAQNLSDLENLRQQLMEMTKEIQRRESMPAEDKMEVSWWAWRVLVASWWWKLKV